MSITTPHAKGVAEGVVDNNDRGVVAVSLKRVVTHTHTHTGIVCS